MTQPSLIPTTVDKFLDGQIQVTQPQTGYRAGMDAVLLAAAVPAQKDDIVLDVGTGVGAAMLCLAARVKGCKIDGIEIQDNLVDLAQHNIILNHFEDRLIVRRGDVTLSTTSGENPTANKSQYDHVLSNPPYFDQDKITQSANHSKNTAHSANHNLIRHWVDYCIDKLKPGGILTLIFTASRMDMLIALLSGKLGRLVIFPLWSKIGQPAKRFIIQGFKEHHKALSLNYPATCVLAYGLVVHDTDGSFTAQANQILRQGYGLRVAC